MSLCMPYPFVLLSPTPQLHDCIYVDMFICLFLCVFDSMLICQVYSMLACPYVTLFSVMLQSFPNVRICSFDSLQILFVLFLIPNYNSIHLYSIKGELIKYYFIAPLLPFLFSLIACLFPVLLWRSFILYRFLLAKF